MVVLIVAERFPLQDRVDLRVQRGQRAQQVLEGLEAQPDLGRLDHPSVQAAPEALHGLQNIQPARVKASPRLSP